MNKSMEKNINSVYEFIKEFRAKYGYSPSIREIKIGLNIKSTSSVHLYLKKLNNKGLIFIKGKNKSRAIDLPSNMNLHPDMFTYLTEIKDFSENNHSENNNYIISKSFFPTQSPLFVYTIKDNDMIYAGIMPNDKLIVKKQNFANNNDIVLCKIHGGIKLRKCLVIDGNTNFIAQNSQCDDIPSDNVKIFAIVVGLIRSNL